MSETNELTNQLRLEISKRFLNVVLWRQNTGGAVGMGTVQQAIGLLRLGQIAKAISLLKRPINFGLEGQADLSGFAGLSIGKHRVAVRIEIEIKAGKDKQRESQKRFQKVFESQGGIYIIAREVDQEVMELEKALSNLAAD